MSVAPEATQPVHGLKLGKIELADRAQGFRREFAASRGQVSRSVSQDHAQDSVGDPQRGKVCGRSIIAAPAERNTRITALLYLALHRALRHRSRLRLRQTATVSGSAATSLGR
jgi:hypothetical protein